MPRIALPSGYIRPEAATEPFSRTVTQLHTSLQTRRASLELRELGKSVAIADKNGRERSSSISAVKYAQTWGGKSWGAEGSRGYSIFCWIFRYKIPQSFILYILLYNVCKCYVIRIRYSVHFESKIENTEPS